MNSNWTNLQLNEVQSVYSRSQKLTLEVKKTETVGKNCLTLATHPNDCVAFKTNNTSHS